MQNLMPLVNTSDGVFHDGDPSTGELGTVVHAEHMNNLQSAIRNTQSELIDILANAGISPNSGSDTQLLNALQKLFLQPKNYLSEIQSAGSEAMARAVENLGLGHGLTGIIGDCRNAKMVVSSPSNMATFTADELIVGTALGGLQYRIGNFNKTINLTITGAGGMDTGSSPNWGNVALYAIYNPTTAESALLAVDSTNSVPSTVYSGANMPAGFTASALVSIVPTRPGSVFAQLSQIGRTISVRPTPVLFTSTATAELTAIDISGGVPKGAVSVALVGNASISGTGGLFLNIYETSVGTGQHQIATTSTGLSATFTDIQLPDSQMVYATYGPAESGFFQGLSVSSYKI
ncbi:hypothetical protein [Lonsdalea britannica]|uniref:hypothetical protein n=1 Tax=Lonsdalea britannica TaxID=1082704 RepID=UPI0026F17AA9|nr:hypothetical protein [Lonsdalea britannica]